jgi:fatty acid synthase subunit alpha
MVPLGHLVPKDGFKPVDILYTPSSGHINITIFEERRGVSVPLLLHFQYQTVYKFSTHP